MIIATLGVDIVVTLTAIYDIVSITTHDNIVAIKCRVDFIAFSIFVIRLCQEYRRVIAIGKHRGNHDRFLIRRVVIFGFRGLVAGNHSADLTTIEIDHHFPRYIERDIAALELVVDRPIDLLGTLMAPLFMGIPSILKIQPVSPIPPDNQPVAAIRDMVLDLADRKSAQLMVAIRGQIDSLELTDIGLADIQVHAFAQAQGIFTTTAIDPVPVVADGDGVVTRAAIDLRMAAMVRITYIETIVTTAQIDEIPLITGSDLIILVTHIDLCVAITCIANLHPVTAISSIDSIAAITGSQVIVPRSGIDLVPFVAGRYSIILITRVDYRVGITICIPNLYPVTAIAGINLFTAIPCCQVVVTAAGVDPVPSATDRNLVVSVAAIDLGVTSPGLTRLDRIGTIAGIDLTTTVTRLQEVVSTSGVDPVPTVSGLNLICTITTMEFAELSGIRIADRYPVISITGRHIAPVLSGNHIIVPGTRIDLAVGAIIGVADSYTIVVIAGIYLIPAISGIDLILTVRCAYRGTTGTVGVTNIDQIIAGSTINSIPALTGYQLIIIILRIDGR